MRPRLAICTIACLPLLVTSALVGCDDPVIPGVALPEAGAFDGFAPGPVPDGAIPDALPDVAPEAAVDAGPLGITVVVVTRQGSPVAGAVVAFHDATGAVIQTIATDATGRAYRPGLGPTAVTAGTTNGNDTRLHTWMGVEDGDLLTLRVASSSPNPGSYNVTWPGAFAGASQYVVSVDGCSAFSINPQLNSTLFMSSDCVRPQNAILGQASGRAGVPFAFSFLKNQAAPVDGGSPPVTLPAWAAATPVNVVVANQPDAGFAQVSYAQIVSTQGFSQRSRGLSDGGATFAGATGFPDAVQALVQIDTGGPTSQAVAKRQAAAATITLDAATVLPRITAATMDLTDRSRPGFTWASAAPLTTSDGGGVQLFFGRRDESSGVWTFVVPPSATSLKAPALPPELAKFVPGAQDFVDGPTILFVESNLLPGYKQLRAIHGVILDESEDIGRLILPQNGDVRGTSYRSQQGG